MTYCERGFGADRYRWPDKEEPRGVLIWIGPGNGNRAGRRRDAVMRERKRRKARRLEKLLAARAAAKAKRADG